MSETQTPGQILRVAREQCGLQQSDVAEQLYLSVQTIIDIENDDYSHFSVETYLRGYIRAYSKLVNINADDVLKVRDAMGIEIQRDSLAPVMLTQNIPTSRRVHRTKQKPLVWGGLGVLLILIIMVVLWWQEQRAPVQQPPVQQPIMPVLNTITAPKPTLLAARKIMLHKIVKKTLHKKVHVSPRRVHVFPKKARKKRIFFPDYTLRPVKILR